HNAVESFESSSSGIVKEEYLESEVKDGFDKIESKTIKLTDDANSIIESVHDIVPITKIDESEVIESVRQGKDKVNDVVEELHELDDSQVRALEPILGRIKTMKQYIADLNSKFKSADLTVSSYDPVKIEKYDCL
ncbi:MAG TPA: T7SS effector LXG polymorphic toxin, partial [Candidatus Avamphibacillus sp.]|nr:T7SS effector LXG polymorphic toxin [Candidatus Avamphibacillus sp.]